MERDDPETIVERVTRVLERHPVRCAVLCGSQASGTATADSDIDIAVGFDDDIARSEQLDRRIDLTVDLVEALGTDDVDVTNLDTVKPAVGRSALEHGYVLRNDGDSLERYRERFERETDPAETHDERMRRFDAILDRLEGNV